MKKFALVILTAFLMLSCFGLVAHHAFTLEIAEHPGDHLPGGAHVVGDPLVGESEYGGILQPGLLQQEGGQALVDALPHDLLHQPLNISFLYSV